MDRFTQEELRCLDRHKIPFSQLFDLKGRSIQNAEVIKEMSALDKHFGYNATSCTVKGSGHTLAISGGHCMQCPNGSRCVGAVKNSLGVGEVYLAGSLLLGFIKVGSSRDSLARIRALNSDCYGGASDWRRLVFIANVKRHADIEFKIQTELKSFCVNNACYQKDGRQQYCNELFSCSFLAARIAFEKHKPKDVKPNGLLASELAKYSFPDRVVS